MGYTKKIAYEAADKNDAVIYELQPTEMTSDTIGFWWCGRYGMHVWYMPLEENRLDLTTYDKVTICSPIWVFGLAAPMRTFCRRTSGQISRADYILVHHMNSTFERVAGKTDTMLSLKREKLTSIRCRTGTYKTVLDK